MFADSGADVTPGIAGAVKRPCWLPRNVPVEFTARGGEPWLLIGQM